MSGSALDTPMMRQYLAVKAQHPDAIVFYRMGDFYEMFLRDAELAAPLLDIALTTRDKGKPDAVPMCGVPVHAADQYLARLAAQGLRVAICEQVEQPGAARRLVRREVVEVVTPGLVGDPDRLEAARELALCALCPGDEFGMAVLDASTGELRATRAARRAGEALPAAVRDELRRIEPRELLLPRGDAELAAALARELPGAVRSEVDAASYAPAAAPAHPTGLARDAQDAASRAAAALLAYLAANQPFALAQVSQLRHYGLGDTMLLDAPTRAHLELFRNGEDGTRARTLIERIDRTLTALGARRLSRWLAYPLLDPAAIAERQDAVAWLAERDRARAAARGAAAGARPRATAGEGGASVRDAARPRAAPRVGRGAAGCRGVARCARRRIAGRGRAAPGGVGAARASLGAGVVPARGARRRAAGAAAGLARRERDRLRPRGLPRRARRPARGGAQGPRVDRRARSHGARAHRHRGPSHKAPSRARLRHRDLSDEAARGARGLRAPADARQRRALHDAGAARGGGARARCDRARGRARAPAARARAARGDRARGRARRGRGGGGRARRLRVAGGGRAPRRLGAAAGRRRRGARDPRRTPSRRRAAAPGPRRELRRERHAPRPGDAPDDRADGAEHVGQEHLSGQVAQIVLLAQMGSFVPAEAASIGVVDRVFTRIGASDRLARGESTFMVEMRETAEILAQATSRSLIILDEIGRGTSTFDGLSIAWAVAEHLHDAPGGGARTLFATHYHELTDLPLEKPRVVNAHFEAREWGEQVLFLRRLVEGGASRSYGIQVARLAGLPDAVLARAREILRNLEGGELDERGRARLARGAAGAEAPAGAAPTAQLGLFEARESRASRELIESLRALDPERTTPLEALSWLASWQARLRDEEGA